MVTGRPLLGQEVLGGPKRVWLWNLEDSREELARIIQAACKHWELARADLEGRLFVDSAAEGASLKLATSTPASGLVINRPLVAALTEELIERRIDYLHVDPFVSSHGANASDNMEVDAIVKEWARVAHDANAAVGLAHHVSKASARRGHCAERPRRNCAGQCLPLSAHHQSDDRGRSQRLWHQRRDSSPLLPSL